MAHFFITLFLFIAMSVSVVEDVFIQNLIYAQSVSSSQTQPVSSSQTQPPVKTFLGSFEGKDIATVSVAILALLVASYTAYRTFLAKFRGNVWFSNNIVLTRVDGIQSLGLSCFFENPGTKPGMLDDLRVKVDVKGMRSQGVKFITH